MFGHQGVIDFPDGAAIGDFKLFITLIFYFLAVFADAGADAGGDLGGCDIYQIVPHSGTSRLEMVMLANGMNSR